MVVSSYVLKEHAVPAAIGFSVIMFLLVLDTILQTADLILGRGVPWAVAGELFFLHTAWQVALAVPMSVLVGSLMAFGRLSADNELTALRALGVGFHQLLRPPLLAGVVVGFALVWFNDQVLPGFNHRARLLTMDIHRKRPTVSLEGREGIFIQDFSNYHILIGEIHGVTSKLEDVLIYKYDKEGYPTTIRASRGEVRFVKVHDEAYLVLYDGTIDQLDESSPDLYVTGSFDRLTLRLGDAGQRLVRTVSSYRNDREMGISTMVGRVSDYDRQGAALVDGAGAYVTDFTGRLIGQISDGSATLEVDVSRADLAHVLSRARADLTLAGHKRRQADRLRVEIHKKFSIPAACVVFVLIAAPIGYRVRRGGPTMAAAISIGFFLVYWLFLIGGEKLADRGFVSPWLAMWSPNLLLGALALLWVTRMSRGPG